MVVKPSILTSFKWQYVFVATMGHMVASGDVGSKWKPTHEFKLERVSRVHPKPGCNQLDATWAPGHG